MTGALDTLTDQHRTCVYRVVQEALTNCVRHAQAGRISVDVRARDEFLDVSVSDDGVGLDPRRRAGGFGLRGIEERVRELGGSVTLESATGHGATLAIRLPLPLTWRRRLRVLLADDHGIVRRGLRSLIETQPDFKVVAEAGDGLEALKLCDEHQPDTLILDIAMPKMNGIEVAERAQKLPHPPSVIILSMHADESYIIRALSAGARAYLLKDATDEDLIPALRAVAAGKPFFSPTVTAVLVERLRPPAAGARSRRTRITCSPSASAKCCNCSPRDGPTRTSRRSSTSACRPWKRTART